MFWHASPTPHSHPQKKKTGFTLLELLVTISIIAILVGLSAVSYTTAQRKGRDARRRGDMKAMQSVYEQYYSNPTNGYNYPANCSAALVANEAPGGWPTDPKNSGNYVYTKNCAAAAFCFCALMENETGNSSAVADGTCSGLGQGTTYFCVKNQQ